MAFLKQDDNWVPTGLHGELLLDVKDDPEAVILEALRKMIPGQAPAYRDIKYIIKDNVSTVVSGKEKYTSKKLKSRSIFFELD